MGKYNDPFFGSDVQIDELRPPWQPGKNLFAPMPDDPPPPSVEAAEPEMRPPRCVDLAVPLCESGTAFLDYLEEEIMAEAVRQLRNRKA